MNWNENETESFAGNFAASKKQRLFFEVPFCVNEPFCSDWRHQRVEHQRAKGCPTRWLMMEGLSNDLPQRAR